MNGSWLFAALVAALAACAPQRDLAPAGEGRPAVLAPGVVAAPPVYAVLGYREQLGLGAGQVAAIDSIGEWLDRSNAPLLARLREQGGRSRFVARRDRSAPRGPAAAALLDSIGAHHRAAVDGLAAVLTAEQRTRLCELWGRRRGERDREWRGGALPRPSLARRRGAASDSLPGRAGDRWPWCARPAATPPG